MVLEAFHYDSTESKNLIFYKILKKLKNIFEKLCQLTHVFYIC